MSEGRLIEGPWPPPEEPPLHVPGRRGAEVVGPVYEGEIVAEPVPVDPPAVPAAGPVWQRPVRRTPVVPAWLAKPEDRRAAVVWAAGLVWHATRYHGLRLPWYAARLYAGSPRGAWRVLSGVSGWVRDSEGRDQRRLTAAVDPKAAVRLLEIQRAQTRARWVILSAAVLAAVLGWLGLGWAGPGWSRTAVLAVLVAVLGAAGRRKDKPILGHAVAVTGRPSRLTADQVVAAFESIGVRLDPSRAFPKPITRDGAGWRADIDLPLGATPAKVMSKRSELASGLRRSVGAVWPEADHCEHAGRAVLWVGDQDMARARQPAWPLARTGRVDLFRPFPFATDQRGRTVTVTLFETNMLIGALPGGGKTAAVRVPMLAAGLDPTAEVWVYELLGKGDLGAAEKFAARYASGLDDGTIERALRALRDARAEVERRATTLGQLPRTLNVDGKVSREIADKRHLGLHPLVLIIDECQNLFGHPEFGKEAGKLAGEIIRMGRALGVILIHSTQRPNADAIPTEVSALSGLRYCLRVMAQLENDMILGTSMYKNGVRATTLRPTDKGIGYLVGASDEPQVVRTFYLDLSAADRIAARARAIREAAGLLTGHAAGEPEPERGPDRSVVDDLLQVVGSNEEAIHLDVACGRLAEDWPARYQGWGATQLRAALTAAKLPRERNVWAERPDGRKDNRAGVTRAALLKAAHGDAGEAK